MRFVAEYPTMQDYIKNPLSQAEIDQARKCFDYLAEVHKKDQFRSRVIAGLGFIAILLYFAFGLSYVFPHPFSANSLLIWLLKVAAFFAVPMVLLIQSLAHTVAGFKHYYTDNLRVVVEGVSYGFDAPFSISMMSMLDSCRIHGSFQGNDLDDQLVQSIRSQGRDPIGLELIMIGVLQDEKREQPDTVEAHA